MEKVNYFELFKNAIEERNVTIKELEDKNILKTNTFYNFSTYCPSINNAIKIANFLKMSLDYILEKTDNNIFRPYKQHQTNFYNNLKNLLNSYNISNQKFLKDLHMNKDNVTNWKNGAVPKLCTIIKIAEYLDCNIDDLMDVEK